MRRLALLAASSLALAAALPAQTVTQVLGTRYNAPAIGNFSTLGSQMGGMALSGRFSDGATFTGLWADLGGGTWGVDIAGRFSVTMAATANSWDTPFLLRVFSTSSTMTQLVFSGGDNVVVFDRTFGGVVGTDSSATGRDFRYVSSTGGFAADNYNTLVTYANEVGLTGRATVGDLFERIIIDFRIPITGMVTGRQVRMNFDVDNVISGGMLVAVPEPATVGMLAAGLGVLGAVQRRRRRKARATTTS